MIIKFYVFRRRSILRTLLFLSICVLSCYSQTTNGGAAEDNTQPTNIWQQDAQAPKPKPNDDKGSEIRKLRDQYADKTLGAHMPLDKLFEQGLSYHLEQGPKPNGDINDSFSDTEAVIVGTFDSFDFVFSESHQSIYTEEHIFVDKIISGGSTNIQPGTTIDILRQNNIYAGRQKDVISNDSSALRPRTRLSIHTLSEVYTGGGFLPVLEVDENREWNGQS